MKTFTSKTVKIAVLSCVSAAFALLNAQTNAVVGNVPVDFTIGSKGVKATAGKYQVFVGSRGQVTLRNEEGRPLAIVIMPVQTSYTSAKATFSFDRKGGVYQFAGVCSASTGCWTMPVKHTADQLEVAVASR